MTLVVAALLFPALFAALAIGCGLLVERATGRTLPGVLLLPLGFAAIVVISQLFTGLDLLSELAPFAVVAAAVGGYVLGWGRLRGARIDFWAAAAVAGVYATLVAVVVATGQATLVGYGLDNVPAVHLMGADFFLHHGHNYDALAPSSYEFTLRQYFARGYPSGGQTALGSVGWLTGQDLAWLYQPYMAFLAALLAAVFCDLAGRVTGSRPVSALVAFLAAQPVLVFGYVMQGSLKELTVAPLIALMASLVGAYAAHRGAGIRRVVPLAVVAAAGVAAATAAVIVYLIPFVVAALVVVVRECWRSNRGAALRQAGAFSVLTAFLALPTLMELPTFVRVSGFLTNQLELGNLPGPLAWLHLFGTWLAGDYRIYPVGQLMNDTTYLLAGIALASTVLGAVFVVRRRSWPVALYMAGALVAYVFVTRQGSPWADGKAMVLFSPVIILAAGLGAAGLWVRGRRVEGAALAAALALGIFWSNALGYHDAIRAPRERLVELGKIGERFAGQGPALTLENEDFALYFLRRADPEGPVFPWRRRTTTIWNGTPANPGTYYDLDDLPLSYVRRYPTIVLRRSPEISRPPSSYRRAFAGRYYEVWRRVGRPNVLVRQRLTAANAPASVPPCGWVRRLARDARRGGARLAFVRRSPGVIFRPALGQVPQGWSPSKYHLSVLASGPGRLEGAVTLARPGRYRVWSLGSFGREHTVLVDGRRAGSVAYRANPYYQHLQYSYEDLGVVDLPAGRRAITILRGGGDLRPGNGRAWIQGPLVFQPLGDEPRAVQTIEAGRWRELCGALLDWIEVVR